MIDIPGKIPIRIFPFFWVLIAMIGWLNSQSITGTAVWSGVILISILVHEFGHALTAVAFGQKAEINLVGLGGVTKREGPSLPKWQDFLIVLNGPLAGLLLFFLASQLAPFVPKEKFFLYAYALDIAILVNLFWTLLNLLPVLPLDGGQLVRIILEGIFGFKGLKLSLFLSIALAGIFSVFFLVSQQFLVGALFLMFGFESYRAWEEMRHVTHDDADEHLQKLLEEALEEMRIGKRKEALDKFMLLREQSKRGSMHVKATQYMARLLAEEGHYLQAYEWLMTIRKFLTNQDLSLLQQLTFKLHKWEESVQTGQEFYQKEPRPEAALLNAMSYAIMGQARPAVGWLRAVQSGRADVSSVIEKREFDAIRETPEFQAWLKSL
ncbi:MAG: M50 family metallopeptidase [Candidatus Protochlamydia sp.]|nr:M50 family metallopeptidase [Candidatus Protochlamydia sp.]